MVERRPLVILQYKNATRVGIIFYRYYMRSLMNMSVKRFRLAQKISYQIGIVGMTITRNYDRVEILV